MNSEYNDYMQLSRGLPLLLRIKCRRGLTFLEALIVMIVIAILTVLAIPSFITYIQEHRLTLTAESMFSVMQYARSEATKRNATIYVSLQTGDSWCYGVGTTSSCACATANTCDLGVTQAPQAQQTSLSTTNITGNAFQFEGSRGAANVNNGKITFTTYGQSTSITVLITQLGDIQLCSSTISGYQTCP